MNILRPRKYSEDQRTPDPVDRSLNECQGNPDTGKFPKTEAGAMPLGVLQDDDIAGCTEDQEIPRNRTPGGKCQILGSTGAGLSQRRKDERDKRDVRYKLADQDSAAHQAFNASEIQPGPLHQILKKSALPDGLHDNKHGRKKYQSPPVRMFHDKESFVGKQ